MIATVSTQDKIIWNQTIPKIISDSFYPSFYKDILRQGPTFFENFTIVFEDADTENLEERFLPLYQAEIMSRESYNLDRDKILDSIRERLEINPKKYKFLFILDKNGALFGATLFSIVGDKLQISFRAYKRDVGIKVLKHKASIDYFGEKAIKEYAIKSGISLLSHGRDSHPYVGRRRIGLALFKLKTGSRPRVPKMDDPEKPVRTIEIGESFLQSQHEPTFMFYSPDENGFYQDALLSYPKQSIHESLVNEYRVVCNWAGIELHQVMTET